MIHMPRPIRDILASLLMLVTFATAALALSILSNGTDSPPPPHTHHAPR
jgi:hypothetical protein